jgi:hypothetical protein
MSTRVSSLDLCVVRCCRFEWVASDLPSLPLSRLGNEAGGSLVWGYLCDLFSHLVPLTANYDEAPRVMLTAR